MSSFTSPLVLEFVDINQWFVKEEFEYHVGSYPSEEIITVPKYFETDLASIPRMFWSILPPQGQYGKAAVVHDYCYRTACYNKKRSDEIFLEGMEVLNVPKWQRTVIYYAVKWFGHKAWNERRKQQHEHGQ